MATKAGPPAMIDETPAPQTLTPELIEHLKGELTRRGLDPALYKFSFDKYDIVFRPIRGFDYDGIKSFLESNKQGVSADEQDWKVCDIGIVWPQEILEVQNWELLPAGIQKSLARKILARSGFIVEGEDQSDYLTVEPLGTPELGPKPDAATVEELKKKYDSSLQLVRIESEWYVIRPVNRTEWKAINSRTDIEDIEELLAEKATVWTRDGMATQAAPKFGGRLAGAPSTLYALIMQLSGFAMNDVSVEAL